MELLRWFKKEFFSWVNSLPCSQCGGETKAAGSLSPSTEDTHWGAQRVESHYCHLCQVATRFPRWDSVFIRWRYTMQQIDARAAAHHLTWPMSYRQRIQWTIWSSWSHPHADHGGLLWSQVQQPRKAAWNQKRSLWRVGQLLHTVLPSRWPGGQVYLGQYRWGFSLCYTFRS